MTPQHLHILQHALGLDQYGRGEMYRDHFVTGEGSVDHPACVELTALGFMTRRADVQMFGGADLFRVTDSGRQAAIANSPAPPKLSASKQRYADFLECDCDIPFGDWLKWKERQRRGAAL
ncbi:hypothetical protein NL532_32000 [Mesorhizobium sp. C120A]|uniref:hypothetical protein n=1 Tax=unclassified Mesorhizobium TaxID=325217 RepID=UPI0003D05F75|nr:MULTISPECIES: hypothetical protein [unclassified Mesorhizobium]ESZ63495.1 hypothetical protein X728_08985 [Mesorhizobium sp. L103C120A0]WJI45067.1 hypothetical protein NL532_32000 [Mesorhizobium sp. C120A]